ncbi:MULTISPECIES: MCE family protein [Mycobacteriaceae]|uniref:Mammalian cell entry protein n=3 Tax=Mycolicibacterium TaxID=1866885 RepID=A0A132PEC0_9MYCO|nr:MULTISPECIES: MCE family protein [Mycolicibacterium]KLI04805.1 mammalian cell entry protein [Mycolicibacterium senegalense]KLO47464.1 mammalian cell entry protein [Mycolicibacterium senegalense]KMV14290.1 mammalian cell entry protein [Mycolicibacterium conceptionense]KWX20671.1 mammalian cell entry protein [Mycolicibacterium wolinskyi]MDV7195244.1 MCE family protein [Mycolicibacterium fortuitum]
MSIRKSSIGLVIFLVLCISATWLVSVTLLRQVSGPVATYSAIFTNVAGLHPGDDVRVAGVRVGRVDEISLEKDALAKVTFRVQREQTLYTDTVASVTYQNIVGQRYMGLSPGQDISRRILGDHGQLPVEQTEPSFDITHLLRGFEPLFALLDPSQVENLTNGIIQALQGDSGSVLALITQTSALAELFAGPDQLLGEVIANLNNTMTMLANQNANLQSIITHTRELMVGLGNRRADLAAAVGSIATTVNRLGAISASIQPDLSAMMTREPGLSAHLTADARERFSYFGANLPAMLKGVARSMQSGAYVDVYACDINITIFDFLGRLVPRIVRAATPGNTIKNTPICR